MVTEAGNAQQADSKEPLFDGRPMKLLLVASTGGHLAELVRLSKRWHLAPGSTWVTFDTPQSRSLLAGEPVLYLPYIAPRDLGAVLKGALAFRKLFKGLRFDAVVSTGAGIALSVLPQTYLSRLPSYYIESVSRTDGPSLTGRIIAMLRLAQLRTQHAKWANDRWEAYPSVLSQFRSAPKVSTVPQVADQTMFVTLGTIRPYRFDTLLERLKFTSFSNTRTHWQLGASTRSDLPGLCTSEIAAEDFESVAKNAQVVVTHAGVGTILNLLEWGIYPVVVPRRKGRNEHVDDHQVQIARLIDDLALGLVVEAEEIEEVHLERAARMKNVVV